MYGYVQICEAKYVMNHRCAILTQNSPYYAFIYYSVQLHTSRKIREEFVVQKILRSPQR